MQDSFAPTADEVLGQLGLGLDPEIAYRTDSIFPKLTGWGSKGQIKRKVQLIRRIEPVLKQMLRPGEEVLYVAKGVQYKLLEQYFLGFWAASINQTVFVLTNARLLMLHANSKGTPRHTYWMIYYSEIETFKATWHGTLFAKLRDGNKLKFTGFPKLDRRQMPQIFEQALEAYRERGFVPQVSQSRENLCSYCMQRVPKARYACRNCGAEFWTPKAIALRSLIFPSWGDFTMRHTGIAVVELIGYGFLWMSLIAGMTAAAGRPDELAAFFVIIPIALLFTHVPDALLTYFIAKKGLHPRKPGTPIPISEPGHETAEIETASS